MPQPTGKLKFAYQTIANMECKIEELKAELNKYKWVSVEDSLPDDTFDWILVLADGAMCTMAYSSKNGFYDVFGNTSGNIIVEEITHWQNLPDADLV